LNDKIALIKYFVYFNPQKYEIIIFILMLILK